MSHVDRSHTHVCPEVHTSSGLFRCTAAHCIGRRYELCLFHASSVVREVEDEAAMVVADVRRTLERAQKSKSY